MGQLKDVVARGFPHRLKNDRWGIFYGLNIGYLSYIISSFQEKERWYGKWQQRKKPQENPLK